MKIIHISGKFRPAVDGLSNYVYNLTTRLAQKHEVTVITTDIIKAINTIRAVRSYIADEIIDKVRVIRLKTKPPYVPYLWSYSVIPKLIKYRNFNADIIHIHSYMQLHSDISAIIAKSISKPFVLTIHAYGFNKTSRYLEILSKIYHSSIAKYILSRANKIIVLDPLAKKFFSDIVEPEKIVIIPNGIEYSRFCINMNDNKKIFLKEKFGINGNVLLFTGLLVKRKGVDILVKAMWYIVKEHPNTYLLIIGTGPEKQKILLLARKLGIQRNIKLLGFVSDEVLPYMYKISDIFVLPSYHEGLPTVILEAMAAGLPIISTRVGGIPYLIYEYKNGILIDPGDVKNLVKAVIELINDEKKRRDLAKRSSLAALEFDWKKIAMAIEKLYTDVLENKK